MGAAGHDVVGMEERFARQALDVFVVGGVEGAVARSPHSHQLSQPELGQVLRHRWLEKYAAGGCAGPIPGYWAESDLPA